MATDSLVAGQLRRAVLSASTMRIRTEAKASVTLDPARAREMPRNRERGDSR